MNLQVELEALGVEPTTSKSIAQNVATLAEGIFDRAEPAADSRALALLHAALVCAPDRQRYGEASKTLLLAIETSLGSLSTYDVGRFWHLRGVAAWRLDDSVFAATRALNRSVCVLASDQSDRAQGYLARVHDTFGQLLHLQGMISDAQREFERSLSLRAAWDRTGMALSLGNLGRLHLDVGDFAIAAAYFERDLALVDNPRVRAQLHSHLAECYLHLGKIDLAEASVEASAKTARAAGDQVGETFALIGEGRVSLARGDSANALRLAGEAMVRCDALDIPARIASQLRTNVFHLVADAQLAGSAYDEAITAYQAAATHLEQAFGTSPIEQAEIHRGLAMAQARKQHVVESALSLRRALTHLDTTHAETLRTEVEAELRRTSYDSWLLHSAGRFIGQRHIEIMLSQAGRMGFRGSRRDVVVMFADLRGFTTLSEQLTPEELIALLNEYLSHMTRCIERHDGTVDKFIGDGIMAIFADRPEGPEKPDAATRAIETAIAMDDELERFNRQLASIGASSQRLAIGIGLHAGVAVAGLIGSPQRRELTVIGDVVNTASRIEGMTKQLGVTMLASSTVVDASDRNKFLLRPVGSFAPKGRKQALRMYEIMGTRDQTPASQTIREEIASAEAALEMIDRGDFATAATAFEALERGTENSRRIGYALLATKTREALATPTVRWAGEIHLADK